MKLIDYIYKFEKASDLVKQLKCHVLDQESCNGLEGYNGGSNIVVYNYPHYIGFKCTNCGKTWGIHCKYLKRKDISNYILSNPEEISKLLCDLNKRMTVNEFIDKFKKNYLDYGSLLDTCFTGVDRDIAWNKMSNDDKLRIYSIIRDRINKEISGINGIHSVQNNDEKLIL